MAAPLRPIYSKTVHIWRVSFYVHLDLDVMIPTPQAPARVHAEEVSVKATSTSSLIKESKDKKRPCYFSEIWKQNIVTETTYSNQSTKDICLGHPSVISINSRTETIHQISVLQDTAEKTKETKMHCGGMFLALLTIGRRRVSLNDRHS